LENSFGSFRRGGRADDFLPQEKFGDEIEGFEEVDRVLD
jgi:hypothetical protein